MTDRVVGHYRILEKIGSGGMGDVFRARDERLGRDVALKLIRASSSDSPDHLRRFEHEARAAAALNHPNILAIYDVGFEGSSPYIVTELLQGKTLRQRLADGPIPLAQASDYALQIASGLIAAHDRHIVHRDLKPENLFLTEEGRIKILDFGVAKLQVPLSDDRSVEKMTTVTKHGVIIGTVAYMSPEQLRGKPVDHRSDIFTFGAILYEMLTGNRAFRGETQVDTMTAVLREEPADTSFEQTAIPPAYGDIVKHCLEKEPENRFQSVKDLVFAVQTLSGGATGTPLVFRKSKPNRVSALPWAITATMATATIALAMVWLLRTPPAPPAYRRLTFESGTIYAARFAANGQSVVYAAAWNGNPVQLFSTVGNSFLPQALNLKDANLLSVSPNGELALVMGGTHSGQLETLDGVLARAPLAGGSPHEVLADVRWADWDLHNQMAVVHYVEGHSRLEFPIGNVLYQSGGWISNIRFSPTGGSIAFMDHPALWDDRGSVSVVDLSGHVKTLSREWEAESGLAWRPDGKEIWFTAAEQGTDLVLRAADLSGKVRTVLALPAAINLEDITADGRALVSLDSKRLQMAFATFGKDKDVDLSWHDWNTVRDISSDGKFVVFEDASESAGSGYVVAIRNVDGSLPAELGEGSLFGLSPDGKWAAASSTSKPTQLMLLPTGAGQPRILNVTGLAHIQNGFGRFLSDGKRVTLNGDQMQGGVRCYVVDLTTAKAIPVTPEGVMCGPSSPDGRFMLGTESGHPLVAYPLQGGEPRNLSKINPNFDPVQWSSDGSAFFGYKPSEYPRRIYKTDIETGKETLLQEVKPAVPAGVVMVAPIVVNRDGTRFAYSYNQTLSRLFIISGLH
jgi:eukaryotic-like serine/threonine-protein kinase